MTKAEKLFKIYDWIRDNGERVAKGNPWSMDQLRRVIQLDTGLMLDVKDIEDVKEVMGCKWPFREPNKKKALTLKTLDARLTAIENGIEELAKKVNGGLYHVKELGDRVENLAFQVNHFREQVGIPCPDPREGSPDFPEETER